MNANLSKYKLYEKVYMDFVYERFPVIKKFNVSEGRLTDLFVHIEYAEFYDSFPPGFLSAIRWTMMEVNEYFGSPRETFTLALYKGPNFVAGTFIGEERHFSYG